MYIDARFKRMHLQSFLKKAASIASRDVKNALLQFAKNPRPNELALLLRALTTSGVWVSHSTLRYLLSYVHRANKNKVSVLPVESASDILNAIAKGEPLPHGVTHEQAFQILFHDIEFAHRHSLYDGRVSPPQIDTTLVLVSGVFNEIFSTLAFARGAEYLSQKTGLRRVSFQVSGTRGTDHNCNLLLKQFETYLTQHPNRKLWVVAFSKGGLDMLHFMHQNPKFSNDHIQGLSLMASPILGSSFLKHRALQTLGRLETIASRGGFKDYSKQYDLLAKNLRKSLSEEFQEDWFKAHYHELPKNPFYTALAFESTWYQSHLWMMMTKLFLQSQIPNDGVVDVDRAQYPNYFRGINLGISKGHHLVGTRSSFFSQEALLEAHLIYLHHQGWLS